MTEKHWRTETNGDQKSNAFKENEIKNMIPIIVFLR